MKKIILSAALMAACVAYGQTVEVTSNGSTSEIEMSDGSSVVYSSEGVMSIGEKSFSVGEGDKVLFVPAKQEVRTTIWSGEVEIGEWNTGMDGLSWGKYNWSNVAVGSELVVNFTENVSSNYWQLRLGSVTWTPLPGTENVYALESGQSSLTVTLTELMKDSLVNHGGLVVAGAFITVSSVELVEKVSPEITIWTGSCDVGTEWKNALQDLAYGAYDWNRVPDGSKLKFYFTEDSSLEYWQIKVNQGDEWKQLGSIVYLDKGDTYASFELTEEYLDALQNNNGLIVQGYGVTLTKIAIE